MHVFLLLVYLGTGEDRRLVSGDAYFASITTCNFMPPKSPSGTEITAQWIGSTQEIALQLTAYLSI